MSLNIYHQSDIKRLVMKNYVVRNYSKCNLCKKIIMPGELVYIIGRDKLSRDKHICRTCKVLK